MKNLAVTVAMATVLSLITIQAQASNIAMQPGQYVDIGEHRVTCYASSDNYQSSRPSATFYRCHAGFFTQHYSDWSYDRAEAQNEAQQRCLRRVAKDSSAACYAVKCESR